MSEILTVSVKHSYIDFDATTCRGNADPDIEFNLEFTIDDYTEEELAEKERKNREFRPREFTAVEQAAINFAINAVLKKSA